MADVKEKVFITSFKTPGGYKIGSFDSYEDDSTYLMNKAILNSFVNYFEEGSNCEIFPESKKFIKSVKENNYGAEDFLKEAKKETINILDSMDYDYRGSIVDKDGKYIGFIGLCGVDPFSQSAGIRIGLYENLDDKDLCAIIRIFSSWAKDSINIQKVGEVQFVTPDSINTYSSSKISDDIVNGLVGSIAQLDANEKDVRKRYPKIITPSKSLIVPVKSLKKLKSLADSYSIKDPRDICLPHTICVNDKDIALLGLKNVTSYNRRADLELWSLPEFSPKTIAAGINEYTRFVQKRGLFNIECDVANSEEDKLIALVDSNYDRCGSIKYGRYNGICAESLHVFQNYPGMPHTSKLNLSDIIDCQKYYSDREFNKYLMSDILTLDNGYTLYSPEHLLYEGYDINKILNGHVKATLNWDNFSIPLGCYAKRIFEWGKIGEYGLACDFMDYTYILLDYQQNYSGFINICYNSGKNVEIELGIVPEKQGQHIGYFVLEAFYRELFRQGCLSVTYNVFEFNEKSQRLQQKFTSKEGTRNYDSYAYGRLWNSDFYVVDLLDRYGSNQGNEVKRFCK